ncbi:alpha/beta hydrolase family protein [Homoserinimonas sp. A447]
MKPLVVLVHSPLVGAATWQDVAERLEAHGQRVAVPDLTPALSGEPPYIEGQVAAVRQAIGNQRAVLVGHSGAGPLLPAFGVGADVAGYVFVDAGLPTPGQSWVDTAPGGLVDRVNEMAQDGWLPPWSLWWGDDGLVELLPDAGQRRRFTEDCPPLPLAMFSERRPTVTGWPDASCAYLRLGESYPAEFEQARQLGWATAELPSHHLAMLTDPEAVADSIRSLAERIA